MKKFLAKFQYLLLAVCCVLFFAGVMTACSKEQEKIEYSITVYLGDNFPASGVSVALVAGGSTAANAKTNTSGTATLSAVADKYRVVLSDLPSGYAFDEEVETDRLGTPLELTLSKLSLTYTVTVKYPDGSAISGATAVWNKNGKQVGKAKTNTSGVASASLEAGIYTVTLEDLPDGYYIDMPASVTESARDATLTVSAEDRITYTVSVVTEGGLKYPDLEIKAFLHSSEVLSVKTDENGAAELKLKAGTYEIVPMLPDGYTASQPTFTTDEEATPINITIRSEVIPTEATDDTVYSIGSIMHDFTLKDCDGEVSVTLSEALETKKAVFLNFWTTWCGPCAAEFPALEEAYADYKDDILVLAISAYPGDSNAAISDYRIRNELTMFMGRDSAGLAARIAASPSVVGISSWPTTVIIDRYGAIATIHTGTIPTVSTWKNMMQEYASDDYVQSFTPGHVEAPGDTPIEIVKPDVAFPDSAELEAAVNNTESGFTFSYYPMDDEYAWPWLAGEVNGRTCLRPSNSGYAYSVAVLITTVEARKNQVFAFDYLTSSELNYDCLYVFVDGMPQRTLSGQNGKWESCYYFVAPEDGEYEVMFYYFKDEDTSEGDDAVYISDMRFVTIEDIDVLSEIARDCATDFDGENGYLHYATVVYGEDGFYHVRTEDGPYLLLNFYGTTAWNQTYALSDYFLDEDTDLKFNYDLDGDGKKENCLQMLYDYYRASLYSDYYGAIPVCEELRVLIEALMQEILTVYDDGRTLGEKEWLEACFYYDRFGPGSETTINPILGIMEATAIPVEAGKIRVDITKPMAPIAGLIYSFIPKTSGIYHIYSQGKDDTYVWVYNQDGIEDGILGESGYDLFGRFPNDDTSNFNLYIYLEAGSLYYVKSALGWSGAMGGFDFFIEYLGTSYTVLEPCSNGFYSGEIDENGNLTGGGYLEGIDYVYDEAEDAYYAVYKDGSRGGKIYLDFKGFTRANPFQSINSMLSAAEYVPGTGVKPFDFRYRVEYVEQADGNYIIEVQEVPGGVDYTEIMLNYAKQADENGLLAINRELVAILTLFGPRVNLLGLENDWLQFCLYYHTYSATT